jgi:glyceraldehyde-3-phosphate dehydrogenase/erythrose-4-phosphate dehydrogenase
LEKQQDLDPESRPARAAATNVIPTASDAVEALPLVVPELAGHFDGVAYRVPVPDGSLVDLAARLGREAEAGEVRDAFRAAAAGWGSGLDRSHWAVARRPPSDSIAREQAARGNIPARSAPRARAASP